MTDIERESTSRDSGMGPQSTADRRPNLGEYLLAMSHEIRAPLNAVIGMSGMLLDSDLGERSRQYAKGVHSAGESLAAILNDLLDLSRVTAGRLAVDPIAFDLRSTIEETASALTPRANDRGLALRVDWRPELPRHVIGDPGRTRQVLGNLIGHAVNATSHGEVVIRVLPDGERGGVPAVRFVVEDTGIGIMPERLARIFDEYVPVDASPYRSFGVTGLGLRLSADLVRRMGGEIGAESVTGKGSRFWFVLPMASAEPRAVPVARDGTARSGRALVVETDLAARGRFIEQLEEAHWEFEFVDDLGRVPDTLRDAAVNGNPFDACFISDYAVRPLHMEVAVKIKAETSIAGAALVMVTAVGSPGEGKKLWHAGFGAYLRKPVPNEEMRDTLAALANLGSDGRGSSLITRHSLAETRNAQAFAPDGIDEMLARLTPTIDRSDARPTVEPPAARAPVDEPPEPKAAVPATPRIETPMAELPRSIATTWYIPIFAAAPPPPLPTRSDRQVSPSQAGGESAQPVAIVDPVVARLASPEAKAEETFPEGLISFEAIAAEAVAEEVVGRAELVDGFLGHDFGAYTSETSAFIEPVDHLPPGAEIDADERLIDAVDASEVEATEVAEAEADDAIELPLEDTVETPIAAAALEIEVAPVESVAEPTVETAAPDTGRGGRESASDLSEPLNLDIVSPEILDQLAGRGGFFTHYLVMTFAREIPATIAQLATATNRGDGTKIKATLTTLRTIGGFVGAGRLSEVCDRLEAAVDRGQLDEAAPLIGTIEQSFVAARDALDTAATTGLPADIPAVSGAFLERLGPDRDGPAKGLAIRLIDSFTNDASAKISELREVVARGDAEQAQRIAQTVKGMCGLVSAEPLAKLCALVEADARLKRIGQADRYLDHLDHEFERVRNILAAARG